LMRGVAEGEIVTAGALANPALRLETTHLQTVSPGRLGWSVGIAWDPPQPGVRSARRGVAEAHLKETESQIREREWALASDVRVAHATLLAIDEQIQVAEDTVGNRRRLTETVEHRLSQGASTRFELDLARLSLAAAERSRDDHRLARTLAATTLIQLLGVGAPGSNVHVAGTLVDTIAETPTLNQAALEDRALRARPMLAAARAKYQSSEETLRLEMAARWPWIRLAAMPRVRRNEFFGATTDLVLGVDLTLPILDTNSGRIGSATSARDLARAEISAALSTLRGDIARALAALQAQQALLRRLREEIEPVLKEHDRLLAIAARAAELDLAALLAAEDLVFAARNELIGARLEISKSWIALERAVGARLDG
jgi:multidrug efflux system outer membrane protein